MDRPGLCVLLLCSCVFLVNGRAYPEVDCLAAPYVAWSLVRNGGYDLSCYTELGPDVETNGIRRQPDGSWVALRPPGNAFAALPVVLPLAITYERPLDYADMHMVGKVAGSLSVALAACFFFWTVRRLAPKAAWPATILFAFGTSLYSVASQSLWMHGPATCWLCFALYLLTRDDDDRAVWRALAGFGLGMAVVTRPTVLFFVLATLAVLAASRRWRALCFVAAGGVIPAVILMHYHLAYFDSLIVGGYESDNWDGAPNWVLGVTGLLIAPSRGIFVYTPAMIVALLGALRLAGSSERPWVRHRGLLAAWLVASLATLLFYGGWYCWWGGWCYGPRFLCEAMPIACLLFAIAYDSLRYRWSVRLALATIVLSIAVHVVGVFGYAGYRDWQTRHNSYDGSCLFSLTDTQIEAHARAWASDIDHFARRRGKALFGRDSEAR